MEHIYLPTNVTFLPQADEHVGKIVITPCHQGYGTTLGNALRRVLLSSLPGAAVESVRLKGVDHEFSPVPGVKEDMVQIIMNLKQMAVKSHSDAPVTLTLKKKGKGEITAGDFAKNSEVEIVNPDLVIMTVTENKEIDMDVVVGKGRGYVPVAEKDTKSIDLGTIMIDSLYTPIRDIGYSVENTRVGDVTDFEELTLTIETNGTISPRAALSQATKILMDHFSLILEEAQKSFDSAPAAAEALADKQDKDKE